MPTCEFCALKGQVIQAKYAILFNGVNTLRCCVTHYKVIRELESKLDRIVAARQKDIA